MTNSAGRVVALSISRKKGTAKANVPRAVLRAQWGFEGDAHAGDWHRQVSILAMESVRKMQEKGLNVRPGAFAENVTTEGIDVAHMSVGERLRIGEAELEVTQIGKECHTQCAIYVQAGDCVMPREGIFARVLRGGNVAEGDPVAVVDRAATAAGEGGTGG
jgi:MOSC domain-containing protein YiiM